MMQMEAAGGSGAEAFLMSLLRRSSVSTLQPKVDATSARLRVWQCGELLQERYGARRRGMPGAA